MCKTWLVFGYNGKGHYSPTTGKVGGLTEAGNYPTFFYTTLAAAQAKADEIARGGNFGIIYESKEFRQIQPVPIVVERVECCDPK